MSDTHLESNGTAFEIVETEAWESHPNRQQNLSGLRTWLIVYSDT